MKLSMKVFLACCVTLMGGAIFWFLSPAPEVLADSPIRMIIGGIVLFLLPGLVWGEILGFRSEHFLETVALSFALTLAVGVALLPVPFLLHASIRIWVGALLLFSSAGIGLLAYRSRMGGEMGFLSPILEYGKQPRQLFISTSFLIAIIALVSVVLYRWGEDLFDINGEKLLHLTYVRYYASLPLSLSVSILKGAPLPNLVNFWEFLLAGWTTLVHVDALPLAYHGRVLIPVFGFPAVFLLIKYIFEDRTRAEAIFWGVLLMCLAWFGLVSPSHLDWVKEDPLRGLFSFMGTVHHADSAMEIMMPLNAALILFALRDKGWRGYLLLAGALSASFLWHTREFFQAIAYFGILGLTLLLLPKEERVRSLRTWVRLLVVILVVIIVFAVLLSALVPTRSFGYDEIALKKYALSNAMASMTDFRSPFHAPMTIWMTGGSNGALVPYHELAENLRTTWSYYLWLILAAFAAPVLALWGGREGQRLVLFFLLLWVLTLSWGGSQFLLIVFTYSEILVTLPRMIYLFAYIVSAAALVMIFERLERLTKGSRARLTYAGFCIVIAGLLLRLWWSRSVPWGQEVSLALGLMFVATLLSLVIAPSAGTHVLSAPLSRLIIGLLLFFTALLSKDYLMVGRKLVAKGDPVIAWFDDRNPFGLSKELIQYMQCMTPGSTVVVDPLGMGMVPLYASQYLFVPPIRMGKTIILLKEIYEQASQGNDPLFSHGLARTSLQTGTMNRDPVDHREVSDMLSRSTADYIIVEPRFYAALLPYFTRYPNEYALLYNNQRREELVVGVKRRPGA